MKICVKRSAYACMRGMLVCVECRTELARFMGINFAKSESQLIPPPPSSEMNICSEVTVMVLSFGDICVTGANKNVEQVQAILEQPLHQNSLSDKDYL